MMRVELNTDIIRGLQNIVMIQNIVAHISALQS